MRVDTERIRGSVAQILNQQELVINRGTEHGVLVGMRFAVLNPRGQEIRDPDSGQAIGSVDVEKTLVKVVRVQERLCVARTFRTYKTPGGPLWSAALGDWGRPPESRVETLKIDEARMRAELEERDSLVKIGDPVVEMRGEEFVETPS